MQKGEGTAWLGFGSAILNTGCVVVLARAPPNRRRVPKMIGAAKPGR